MAQNQKKKEKQDDTTPQWYWNTEKWEPDEKEVDDYLKTWLKPDGTKMGNYVFFEILRDKEWHCRTCTGKKQEKEGLSSDQIAGGGGVQSLESGRKTKRQGIDLQSADRDCSKHGGTRHDRWTGFFVPKFSASSVPAELQEKIFEMANYKDAVENRERDDRFLMVDHKFPRGQFRVHDDIDNNGILDNLKSNDQSKIITGKEQCKKYYQILKKDDVGNHNKMKDGFCTTCCTCPACEENFSKHTDKQLTECSKKPAKTPGSRNGKRGLVMGINFFYNGGTEDWPKEVPRKGIEAEKGCEGCGWYDIAKWREELNKKLMGH